MAKKRRATRTKPPKKKSPLSVKPKAREPERDYSHRTLIDKLGVKVGQRVAVLGVDDAAFLDELAERVPNFYTGEPQDTSDLIFYAIKDRSDLPEIQKLATRIAKTGAVWGVFPKGQGHIRDTDVIASAKAAGLVDNKVCRFSETHTALRLCIPVAKR
jgi:hypothetical protein